jgi:hypothetical protein
VSASFKLLIKITRNGSFPLLYISKVNKLQEEFVITVLSSQTFESKAFLLFCEYIPVQQNTWKNIQT